MSKSEQKRICVQSECAYRDVMEEQIKDLQSQTDRWLARHAKEVKSLQQKLARAREALKYYGDIENYDLLRKAKDEHGSRWVCPIEDDEGKIAQQALKELDKQSS